MCSCCLRSDLGRYVQVLLHRLFLLQASGRRLLLMSILLFFFRPLDLLTGSCMAYSVIKCVVNDRAVDWSMLRLVAVIFMKRWGTSVGGSVPMRIFLWRFYFSWLLFMFRLSVVCLCSSAARSIARFMVFMVMNGVPFLTVRIIGWYYFFIQDDRVVVRLQRRYCSRWRIIVHLSCVRPDINLGFTIVTIMA